jgi:hypothetical protein
LGGAVYLLIAHYLFAFVHRCKRSSILSIRGRGMLLNAAYSCWIIQVLSRGTVVAVL